MSKSKTIQIRVSETEYEKIKERSESMQMDISKYTRTLFQAAAEESGRGREGALLDEAKKLGLLRELIAIESTYGKKYLSKADRSDIEERMVRIWAILS